MIDWTSCSWLGFMIKRCTERVSHPYSSKCTAPPTHTVPGRITHVPPMTTRGGFRGGRRSQGYQWLTITLENIQHRDNREKDLILVCNSRNNIWTLNFLNQYPEYIWGTHWFNLQYDKYEAQKLPHFHYMGKNFRF